MSRKGFTLIELLVASVVFLLAVAAFGYLLNSAKSSLDSASQLNQAFYMLQAQMEEIKTLPYSSLPALNGSSFAENKGKIAVLPVLTDLQSVQLDLFWKTNKNPATMYTLRSKY